MLGVCHDFHCEHSANERIFFGKMPSEAPNTPLILIVSKIFLRGMLFYCNVNNLSKTNKTTICNALILKTKYQEN